MAFGSISTDLYLPAMPPMAAALRAGPGAVAWTLTGYVIGFSAGQLLWGPISDRFGRRIPVACGLVAFIIGSIGCALAGSAPEMIGWRVVQAVGACAGVALARAMARDLFAGPRAAQMLSTLMSVMAIAPLVGPLIGAEILSRFGWRAIFWALVCVGVATLPGVFALPETLPPERRNLRPLASAFAHYLTMLGDRRILSYAATGSFFYVGLFAYLAGSPFAYIGYHHASAELYGVVFGANVLGIMATNTLNARLVGRFGGDRILKFGAASTALAGLATAIDARAGFGGLFGLALPIFAFVSCNGFLIANSLAGAMAGHPTRAGAISSLVGALQYGGGILGSAWLGALADGTPWPMGFIIGVAGLGSAASAFALTAPAGVNVSAGATASKGS